MRSRGDILDGPADFPASDFGHHSADCGVGTMNEVGLLVGDQFRRTYTAPSQSSAHSAGRERQFQTWATRSAGVADTAFRLLADVWPRVIAWRGSMPSAGGGAAIS